MVDTERFQLGPELVQRVTVVAAQLAVERDGLINPLQVVPYMPVDVESVCRALESVEDDLDLERVERDGISYFEFEDPEVRVDQTFDLEAGEHLEELEQLEDNLAKLNLDDDWSRKVREQHGVLRVVAKTERRTFETASIVEASEVPSSRVQSLLNDFSAEGYATHDLGDDDGTVDYTFPALDYPDARFRANMSILDKLQRSEPSKPVWGLLAGMTLVLLIVLIVIRFYTG